MALITVRLSAVYYDSRPVISNISLALNQGQIYSLVGASGCGKSTLLKTIGGINQHYEGSITMGEKNIQQISRAYVPQNYGLLPWKRIKENALLPTKIDPTISISTQEIEEVFEALQLTELLHRYPHQLSGGQQQRVALARAFIQKPDILLMDEPFSALDTITAERSQDLFIELWKRHKTTTLFVTHNIDEAVKMGKEILLMSAQSGSIVAQITNPTYKKDYEGSEKRHLFVSDLKQQLRDITPVNNCAVV